MQSEWVNLNALGTTQIGVGSAENNVGIRVEIEGLWSPWNSDAAAGSPLRWYGPSGSSIKKLGNKPKWCALVSHGPATAYPNHPLNPPTDGLPVDHQGGGYAVVAIQANFFGRPITVRMNDEGNQLRDNENHATRRMRARFSTFSL